jgi:hypothetical protein
MTAPKKPPTKEELRAMLRTKLSEVVTEVNTVLRGEEVDKIEAVLERLGRGGELPHWYAGLENDGTLPNMDGKTVGSVIEMLLVGVLETYTFKGTKAPALKISPAKGVDLPDLDLSVKSPSKNYCTSEPFFSAYERLIGSDHDVLVLITDYQEKKKKRGRPLKLQIVSQEYLTKTQVADKNLCRIALMHRDWLVGQEEARAQRVFRFLAYVNQADWRAKRLVRLVEKIQSDADVKAIIKKAEGEFKKANEQRKKKDKDLLPDEELAALKNILDMTPFWIGIVDACDNWVVATFKENARTPNDDEWKRIKASPLDGRIGMSLALQWRYNFGSLFGKGGNGAGNGEDDEEESTEEIDAEE